MNGVGAKARWLARMAVSTVCVGAVMAGGAPTAFVGAAGRNNRTCVAVVGSGLRVESVSASTTWR
ncbi:hypothetical protein DY245_02475 [Streptomyces inhibens]|uniref:Uncharacterized protein n=1 Tax=Streptomyces inhibens TaxID=2293571 RepID=A0A371QB68_STRIH|nr:hypothetical protein [Streptomyces inhibens]REK91917.1 hypothetical protein DY245_02475 [Streptomyces inhibens]